MRPGVEVGGDLPRPSSGRRNAGRIGGAALENAKRPPLESKDVFAEALGGSGTVLGEAGKASGKATKSGRSRVRRLYRQDP